MPQFPLTLPARAVRRCSPALWRLAILALVFPAVAQAQEEFDPPLTTTELRRDFETNKYRQFQAALKLPNPAPADQDILREGAQYYLHGLTLPELRKNLPEQVTEDLMRELYGGLAEENARRFVCQEIVDKTAELLPDEAAGRLGQPHVVRLNLAIMLRRLNVRQPDARQGAIPFVPARTALLLILNDPGNTRTEARYWAAEGLGRICNASVPGVTDGDLGIVPRAEIGVALASAMNTPHAQDDRTHIYPMQIMKSLGDCGLSRDATGDPILVETLAKCLANTAEHDLVRSMAALSLSRLGRVSEANGVGGGVNVPLIISLVMEYGRELAEKLKAGNGDVHTRRAIMNLYFAFEGERPLQAEEQKTGFNNQILRAGLGQHAGMVQSAYQAILPLFQEVAQNPNPNITDAMIESLDGWIEANPVEDRRITPESDPLPLPGMPGDPDNGAPANPDPAPEPEETEEP